MNVLIIEDEKNLANAIKNILEEQRWKVNISNDGQEGFDLACSGYYDIILLDIMLPSMDGFQILYELRKMKVQTPVLILSALDEMPDKIKGLDLGADDYMTKPFDMQELLARVRVLTRRKGEVILDELSFGDLTLSIASCELICKNKKIHLSYKEFEIMKLLLAHPKILLSKENLIDKVWGNDSQAIDNNVEAYISFLRKKLNFLKSNVQIKVVRKVGYYLEFES